MSPARPFPRPPALHARLLPLLLAPALATLPGGCAAPGTARAGAPVPTGAATIAERYVTPALQGEELDSLATWRATDGRTWLIASDKAGHRLVVFDADTGARLRTIGGPGTRPGQFDRPNGLAVVGGGPGRGRALLFVVERDNHRVQVLALPGFEPLAVFGQAVLRSPYGIWIDDTAPDALEAYVTDSFMYGERFDVVPPLPELAQRVRRFRIRAGADGPPQVEALGSFGDTSAEGGLRMVESLAGDPARDRLLVADESTVPGDRRSNLREYTLAGRYTGRSLPERSFDAEAEGVALWRCAGGGYWVAVDQLTPLTRFHVFGRDDLRLRGSWQGATVADTDGVALRTEASDAFPGGALFAVHADRSVAAFDLREVVRSLGLDPACAAP